MHFIFSSANPSLSPSHALPPSPPPSPSSPFLPPPPSPPPSPSSLPPPPSPPPSPHSSPLSTPPLFLLLPGRYGEEFVEKRKEKLQMWTNRVARHPILSRSAVFQHFLTCPDSDQGVS